MANLHPLRIIESIFLMIFIINPSLFRTKTAVKTRLKVSNMYQLKTNINLTNLIAQLMDYQPFYTNNR